MKIVIVGCGLAGNEVAFHLKGQKGLKITMISREGHPEYDPCGLPYYIGRNISREALFRKSFTYYQEAGIRLVVNSEVTAINRLDREVCTEQGERYPYDRLVLAHGGSLFRPPLPGIDKEGVFSCKSLADADRLDRHEGRRAVIIGSGAIGVEVAEGLKRRGYEVAIIELLPWILPTLFDEPAARRLEKELNKWGIDVFTGERVVSIDGGERVGGVTTDRREIPCDTVVLATGVLPGKALAETAGLKVARGIIVDSQLATDDERIYACGDCAETVDAFSGEMALYQLKHNALEQGRIVAANILGKRLTYQGAYAFARAHFFTTHAVSFGKTLRGRACVSADEQVLQRSCGNDYLQVILKDGMVVGVQAVGRYATAAGFLFNAMWQKVKIETGKDDWARTAPFSHFAPLLYDKWRRLLGRPS